MITIDFLNEADVEKNILLLFISILVGLIIGSEREYRNKSAGLRTFILVSFGACVFTILSIKIGVANPDRLAANIITGIGFLGAGVIFKDENKVAGITTATTIWATASLGMCIGSGNILLGVLGTIVVLLILNVLYLLQNYIDNAHKIRDYHFNLSSPQQLVYCENLFGNHHLKSELIREASSGESFSVTFRLTGNSTNHHSLIAHLRTDTNIKSYQY